jgi:hypothetical protein
MHRAVVGDEQQLVAGPSVASRLSTTRRAVAVSGRPSASGAPMLPRRHERHQRAGRGAATGRAALQARPRHGHGEQRHRERPQGQQQPLLEPQPADLALVHLGQELERWEAHLARLPPCEQVDQHRDGGGGEPEQNSGFRKFIAPAPPALRGVIPQLDAGDRVDLPPVRAPFPY